ncbi:MAG: hypothetical protein AB1831_02605 [Pseudomonadota bacterium]
MNRRLSTLLACTLFAAGAHARDAGHAHDHAHDPRMPLILDAGEAAHVSGEMRVFLASVQEIVAALARNDMKRVAEAAAPAGVAAAHAVPPSLRTKLPLEFKRLGRATHVGFDDLARDAASMGDPALAMQQLGEVMQNCVACHATFRLEVRGTPTR